MAKRKKKGSDAIGLATPSGPSRRRVDVGIEDAENGYIVRTTSEGLGKNGGYESKNFIAPSEAVAHKIAKTHMKALTKKSRSKKTTKRKVSVAKI